MQGLFKSCALLVAVGLCAGTAHAAEKVIFDTDFNVLNDDGKAFIMLAQLQAQKRIELLGMTLVSGNAWVDQEQVDALKAVERMGVEKEVGVYSGAAYRCCMTTPLTRQRKRCLARVGRARSKTRAPPRPRSCSRHRMAWRRTPNCAARPPRSSLCKACAPIPIK